MENVFASHNNLDEVVFENRNKSYGAYLLRKSYDQHLAKALLGSLLLMFVAFGILYLLSMIRPSIQPAIEKVISIDPTKVIRQIEYILDVPPPQIGGAANNSFNQIQIVRDHLVPQRIEPPVISSAPVSSGLQQGLGSSTGLINGGITDLPVVPVEPIITEPTGFADVMPSFDGGKDAMDEYIRKELIYPKQAIENAIEGKVIVSFVVLADGSITQVKILRGIGFGTEEEAIRVVSNMPKWIPGKLEGKNHPVRLQLPLFFQLN